MTIYNQPDAQAFAENAPPSEIVTFTAWLRGLGIAFDETDGKPMMNGINDVFNRITQGIKYLEQYGIPLWRSDLEYPVSASVVYNGIQYRCIAQNTNAQPDLSQNSWQSAIIDNLTSTSTTQALSAKQGKAIKDTLDLWSAISDGTTNGAQTLPNGRVLMWGEAQINAKVNSTTAPTKINFPRPFPKACYQIIPVHNDSASEIAVFAAAIIDKLSFSASSYRLKAQGEGNPVVAVNGSTTMRYIAIGE